MPRFPSDRNGSRSTRADHFEELLGAPQASQRLHRSSASAPPFPTPVDARLDPYFRRAPRAGKSPRNQCGSVVNACDVFCIVEVTDIAHSYAE